MTITTDRPETRTREFFSRSFALDSIEIVSRAKGGDGRTVEAYAAVFDQPTEINDQHGRYMEVIDRSAFNRTLANNGARRALLLYNHGMSVVDGKPDSLAGVPLGHPIDIRADGKGLLTVSRYNKTPLADSVLEAIKNDDIRAQSFRGAVYRSTPNGKVPRTRAGDALPTVTRMELGLRDYGPTPTAYYEGASIVAVRSASGIFSDIAGLDEDERAELFRMMLATTRDSGPEPGTATPLSGPGTEDPRTDAAHSGRIAMLRLRAEAALHGV